MVVKWSSEKDQFILTHILEDKNIKITTDVLDAMIAAWPTAFGAPPTRKAFTEHFSKIRKASKAITNNNATAPTTPSTTAPRTKKTPATKTPAKRKKANITSDTDDEAPPTKTPAKRRKNVAAEDAANEINNELADLGVKVKDEPIDDDQSPSEKPARRGKGTVHYAESDDGEVSHPEDSGDDEYINQELVAAMSAYLDEPDSEDDAEV
ncbi:hypothetical protein E4T49_05501 [Aureobasidium sp. EXF-10728]|nr:hypothetical protein E4T49_05501 [Aureobasidium sp. EXF-10728]